jgi:hypothetical protein
MAAGKQYAVSGRVSGDTSHVASVRAGSNGDLASVNAETGEFSATLASSGDDGFMFLLNGTLAPSSVTIESLSIREVIAAPTNVANGFVEGDYDRQNGLTGDGATTYLDSGRAGDDDPQDDRHRAAYVTATPPGLTTGTYMGHSNGVDQFDLLFYFSDGYSYACGLTTGAFYEGFTGTGLVGYSRASSEAVDYKVFSDSATGVAHPSTTPLTSNALVFGSNDLGGPDRFTDATIAFYSIGTSLDLALLDTHVTNLITAIGEAL